MPQIYEDAMYMWVVFLSFDHTSYQRMPRSQPDSGVQEERFQQILELSKRSSQPVPLTKVGPQVTGIWGTWNPTHDVRVPVNIKL